MSLEFEHLIALCIVGLTVVITVAICQPAILPPQDAIKACIEKDWIANYVDHLGGDKSFTCAPPGTVVNIK